MELPIQFDRPGWLILIVLIVPIVTLAWSGLKAKGSRGRAIASTLVRCLVVMSLALAIARPIWEERGNGVTVIAVLDQSQSVPRALEKRSIQILEEWTSPSQRGDDDRFAVIGIGRESVIGSMPSQASLFELPPNDPDGSATNIAKGIQMAMALFPRDTASRILLISDGNETDGQIKSISKQAKANGIPIDVLPLMYEHEHEVLIQQVVAPSQARSGQSIPVRIVLRSLDEARGELHLLQNGIELDISPNTVGNAAVMTLSAGVTAVKYDIPIQNGGPQKFEAMWVPQKGTDTVVENNTGLAVSFVSKGGATLLVTQNELNTQHLVEVLASAGVNIQTCSPSEIPRDSIGLSIFDSIILVDIPRWSIDDLQEKHLHSFVHDLGGGLVCVGGPSAFGAGGWIGSLLEQAMPIKCEPPQSRELPRGALALIMHSCEMPEGNYWGQRMAEAAVESLTELDYVGIIEYDWNGGADTKNNSGWTLPMQLAGDKSEALDAIKSLVYGDMQDFSSPMELALDGLVDLDASQRHVIIISDGDPIGPSQELLTQFQLTGVTVSTVMVGGHGSASDRNKMQGIATVTGGRFYMVNDPNALPSIFIKEAQLNSRSLIQEGSNWDVAIQPSMIGPVQAIAATPQVGGYVVAGTKDGFAKTPWVIPVNEGDDPLLAWWHYGLGKSIALTTDLGTRWATQWPSWSEFPEFLEGCVRWSMRGSISPNMTVRSFVENGRGVVQLDAINANKEHVNFMQAKAVVVNPSGDSKPINLQQIGPGSYRAEFDAIDTGAWLVNIVFQDADGEISGRLPTAISVPYAREYASTVHNASLLNEIALQTGGRVLSFDDVGFVNLFDKETLVQPSSPTSMWDLLAIIAASLLLLDVAIRRLWIDTTSFQSLLAPADTISSSSVDAYRKVQSQQSIQNETVLKQSSKEKEPGRKVAKKVAPREEPNSVDNLSHLLKKKRDRQNQEDES